ncbi:MAG: sugar transferase [Bacteroidales bacterium]|nr:sugar transferase [Bacteroidales bacterium]
MLYSFFKRLFDIIGALILLPFVLLEIIILAPIIWLTDKGPVFYNANRAGKDYKPFKMFKLRSMYVNSPDLKNADGSTFNSDNDPRVTPIGRLLRKTSLDEFPQFLNILLGHMSFVGPRPKLWHADRKLSDMDELCRKSFSVRPGVTGYAQAYFRNSITQDEKVKWDAFYADNLSFGMDLRILWQTVVSVLGRKNINTEQSYRES